MRLIFSPSAAKTLTKAPKQVAADLLDKLQQVAANPMGHHPWAKRLTEQPGFRVRQGDWRALYRLDHAADTMIVDRIAKRDEVYRSNAIRPLHRTEDTVTLRSADFDALLEALDDAEDVASLMAAASREDAAGKATARSDHLPAELVIRLVAGEHPLQLWREHRGFSSQKLAEAAGVSRSYISEIEGRSKPGSVAAYRKLANTWECRSTT